MYFEELFMELNEYLDNKETENLINESVDKFLNFIKNKYPSLPDDFKEEVKKEIYSSKNMEADALKVEDIKKIDAKNLTDKEVVKLAYLVCDTIDDIITEEDDSDETILYFLKDRDDVKEAAKKLRIYFNNDYSKMDDYFEKCPTWNYFSCALSDYLKEFF